MGVLAVHARGFAERSHMILTLADAPPPSHLTCRPLATFDRDGIRATLSARFDGWFSYVVGNHPHWCEAGACRTRDEAVAEIEAAVRARGVTQSRGLQAADPRS